MNEKDVDKNRTFQSRLCENYPLFALKELLFAAFA
jgi:hypothetical protein